MTAVSMCCAHCAGSGTSGAGDTMKPFLIMSAEKVLLDVVRCVIPCCIRNSCCNNSIAFGHASIVRTLGFFINSISAIVSDRESSSYLVSAETVDASTSDSLLNKSPLTMSSSGRGDSYVMVSFHSGSSSLLELMTAYNMQIVELVLALKCVNSFLGSDASCKEMLPKLANNI